MPSSLSGPQGPWTGPRHKAIIQSRIDIEPGAHHAGDGGYGAQLEVNVLRVPLKQREKLNAHDGNFLVNAFNSAGLVKLKLLVFIKDPAIKSVLAGVLVTPGGAYRLLFSHKILKHPMAMARAANS
jgi:hypothetical protein